MSAAAGPILRVEHVSIDYGEGEGATRAVRDVSIELAEGEFVGLVGESGSGKSTLGFALTRLAKPPARLVGGRILFDGTDVGALAPEQLRAQRQGGFAMVLQSGMNALNPVRSVRHHFVDIYRAHRHVEPSRWEARSRELVGRVQLPESVLDRYPGELSGGMRQRVSIALALSLEPRLMVFDEPTTALDVLVQHAVMDTIIELQRAERFTAVLISHDLGVVLEATDRVLVMHDGRIVEDAPSLDVLQRPSAEYTRMLLSHYADPRAEVIELPGLRERAARPAGSPVDASAVTALHVESVSKRYPGPRRGEPEVVAVDDVSFELPAGRSLALVGASGSGKSTLAKLITGVEKPTSGELRLGEQRIDRMRGRQLRTLRKDVQMVFQDPYAALNPLHTVEYTLTRPVENYTGLSRGEARERVLELLRTVGLAPEEEFAAKLPHQLSGGQRQRVVIARALASEPQVLIADEPVSMLDVSLRAGVLALLEELRESRGLSLLYITHDLLSARLVTDEVIVLNRGRIVERGVTAEVLRHPQDEYTIALLDAVPNPERARA
ncbi:ABC transporter ATP-binding protein [Rathayibacter tanaceti]|uniref:Dipeptide ABC transporter ATP-binding protein n=2 Tax=Rathayibacter tanaceti TaxID=1671680 RepID=A0A162FXD7_9MICO|nr:ABC transporter ATP-binding protein [Rathayibacter tanaceti]KZX20950.1 Glutathione import ATP-binding protein GsiA [Rathayibacter tanaceti]QHC56096.1 dipeptide ABC transporter ATP-binding protein [Rathayibacter tanaceti]TCO36932.1 peptide/nickel transport system ATP-binding protein [Rathayibacter tanaceti]